ncbi:hypothetical protein R1sor_014326 [Riccia sorocarpa]|uniref:Thioredoxin domain-containing protein n=1 Tax=Riccia sorocarpa TaxID=122646 RepID=A0ABD3HC38_9MARC
MEGLAALRQVVTPTTSSVRSFHPQRSPLGVGNGLRCPPTFRRKLSQGNLQFSRRSSKLKVHAKKQTFTSFDDMIANSDLPVLVDFYATWCGPCQFMAPILSDVGKTMSDKIRVVKVDTEKYPAVASRYGISALPTFVLFVDGKPIDWLEGAKQRQELIEHIEKVLAEETSRKQNAAT